MQIEEQIKTEAERYFIVMYIAGSGNGQVTGCTTLITDSGYLTLTTATQAIYDSNKRVGHDLKDLVLTNIIEISKSDYNDWLPPPPKD